MAEKQLCKLFLKTYFFLNDGDLLKIDASKQIMLET